jgi:hypothetical protein
MATTYKMTLAMPIGDTLPRNEIVNTVAMQHSGVGGALSVGDAEVMLNDAAAMYQTHYGVTSKVTAKLYAIGPPPKYPFATVVKGTNPWTNNGPREVALCLSFARNKTRPRERGRIYLIPSVKYSSLEERPSAAHMTWALNFFKLSNLSFPDLGGVDWKFGIWSPTNESFVQASEAWVDDEWDTVRSRGLKPTTRQTSVREG